MLQIDTLDVYRAFLLQVDTPTAAPICPLCGPSRVWVLSGEPQTPDQRATIRAGMEATAARYHLKGMEVL